MLGRVRATWFWMIAATAVAPLGVEAQVKALPIVRTATSDIGTPIVYPKTDSAEVSAVSVELAPAAVTGLHLHKIPALIYVLEGALTVETAGYPAKTHEAGELFLEAQGLTHEVKNLGTGVARAVVIFIGVQGQPTTFRP